MSTSNAASIPQLPHHPNTPQNCEPNHAPGTREAETTQEAKCHAWTSPNEGRHSSSHDPQAEEAQLGPAQVLQGAAE